MRAYGYQSRETTYLQYCHDCRLENYAMNVPTGRCTWCGAGPCSEVSQKKGSADEPPETPVSAGFNEPKK